MATESASSLAASFSFPGENFSFAERNQIDNGGGEPEKDSFILRLAKKPYKPRALYSAAVTWAVGAGTAAAAASLIEVTNFENYNPVDNRVIFLTAFGAGVLAVGHFGAGKFLDRSSGPMVDNQPPSREITIFKQN